MSINHSVLIISCLIHLILLYYLLKAFGPGKWLLAVVPWFLLMASARLLIPNLPMGGQAQQILVWAEGVWLPSALLCAVLLVLGSLFMAARGILAPRSRPYRPRRRSLAWIAMGVSLVFVSYCLIEANFILITRHLSVETDKLPADSGPVRVVFVSDIHLSDWIGPWRLRGITAKIQAQNPDIIILGGDVLDADRRERGEDLELLRGLQAPGGKFAVLGNHEVAYGQGGIEHSVRFLENAGFQLLRQDSVFTEGIRIVGVDDPNAGRPQPAPASNPLPVLQSVKQDEFILLVKHRPSAIPETVGLFDFQLSGHTHGGQVWPVRYLTSLYNDSQPDLSLHFGRGGVSRVYVSNGTGFSKTPLRFLTPPEIVVLDIVPK